MKDKKQIKWYDNANLITTLIISVILLIIVCSQSFVIGDKMSLTLFGSIINHNSIYLLVLVYFISLKFKIGKKYFNYLNVFLLFIYVIIGITSFLTLIQSVSLNTILTFILNLLYVIYFIHVLFRDTRFWKEFRLDNSPFNEISNDSFYYAIVTVALLVLVVNLISTVVVSGLIISLLDTIYYVLLARYIYLYGVYLDKKKINVKNSGNFDEIKENVKDVISEMDTKVQDVFDTKEIVEKVKDTTDSIKEEIDNVINNPLVDDKKSTKRKKKGDK